MTNSDYFKDKSILVTGGCGSIGSEIVKQLTSFNPKMIKVLDINESGLFYLQHKLKNTKFENVRYLIGDIRDKQRLLRAMKGVDIVFHAAALKHVPLCEYNPYEAIQTNIIGTQNVVDCARELEISQLVSISTDKAVNPVNTMGATKLLSEKLVLGGRSGSSKTKFSCVRFGNVLNSRGSVIPLFKYQIKQGGPVTITSKDMTRFFMSISQAVNLIFDTATKSSGGEIFILKMKTLKIIDLAEVMIETFAPKYGFEPEQIETKIVGIRPGEKLYEALFTDEEIQYLKEYDSYYVLKPGFEVPHLVAFSPKRNIGKFKSHENKYLTKDEIFSFLSELNLI